MIVQTPYGPTNTNGGEILDLTPLRKRPRKSPPKHRYYRKQSDTQFLQHLAVLGLLAVVAVALVVTQ